MSDWWIVISEICEEKKQFEVLIVEARCLLCNTENDLKLNVNNHLLCTSYYVGEESVRANFNENTKGERKRTMFISVQTTQKNTTRQSDFIFFVALSDFGRFFFLTWSGDSEDLATFAVTLRRVSASWDCSFAGTAVAAQGQGCLLYTSPSPRDGATSRMPSSA